METPPADTHPYVIMLDGHVSEARTRTFAGMKVTLLPDGRTRLSGNVTDQSELFGILIRIRDIGIPLISVTRVELGSTISGSNRTKQGD